MFRNLLSNRVTEKDIRDWLDRSGYYGRSARFDYVELHAIQRPGWLQIFRFACQAKTTDDQWEYLFGIVRDDERYNKTDIEVFATDQQRSELLDEWSAGLIVRRSRYRSS